MAKAKQTVRVSKTTTKSKTKTKKSSNKGNQKRCPACGRFI